MIRLKTCAILFLWLIGSLWAYQIPEPKIEFYLKGFQVAIPQEEGITNISIKAEPNIGTELSDPDIWMCFRFEADVGRWIYKNQDAEMKIGDVLYYWIRVVKYGSTYEDRNGIYFVDTILYTIPHPRITVYSKGFDFSVPNVDGITDVTITVSRNPEFEGVHPDIWKGICNQLDKDSNRWIYKNHDAKLEVGNLIHYSIAVVKDGKRYEQRNGLHLVDVIEYAIPKPRVKVYSKGFEFSIPNENGIIDFNITVICGSGIAGGHSDNWMAVSFQPDIYNNIWTYKNQNAELKIGDVLHYWISVAKDGNIYEYRNGIYFVDTILHTIPQPRVEVYSKGYEFSIPNEDDITDISITVPRVPANEVGHPDNWMTVSFKLDKDNNRWTYKNQEAELKIGDVLHYWISVAKDGNIYEDRNAIYLVDTILYTIPQPKVTVYSKGFDFSIPTEDGITDVTIRVRRNPEIEGGHRDIWMGTCDQPDKDSNRWTYSNHDAVLEVGNVIHYSITVVKDGKRYEERNGVYLIDVIFNPSIEVYQKGFKIAIPIEDGFSLFTVVVKINPATDLHNPRTWTIHGFEPDKDKRSVTYRNHYAILKVGDILQYSIYAEKDGNVFKRENSVHVVDAIIII